MATTIKATRQVVEDYQRLFVNRRAYTMQSMRPHLETGRHYYFRPSKEGKDIPPLLTEETIRRHLEGEITIGLYAISPSTQRCKWVAIDADYKGAMEDLLKLQHHLAQDRVEPALEMSQRGGHLWIFLATPLLARECRIYIHDLALRLGVPVKASGLADGIEVFPKHDAISAGEFGNAIRGPLGIHRGANRRFWFYGADYRLEAQIEYLNGLRKVTEEQLRRFIAGKRLPHAVLPTRPLARNLAVGRQNRNGRSEFRILDHLGKVRKAGRNYVTRCPACADSGRDRSGDNLAILIEDPRFYKCWAGCTKDMIRAALGHPARARHSA
jgi:TOTE conflict system, Archaeo-Eukaryotic Primase domain